MSYLSDSHGGNENAPPDGTLTDEEVLKTPGLTLALKELHAELTNLHGCHKDLRALRAEARKLGDPPNLLRPIDSLEDLVSAQLQKVMGRSTAAQNLIAKRKVLGPSSILRPATPLTTTVTPAPASASAQPPTTEQQPAPPSQPSRPRARRDRNSPPAPATDDAPAPRRAKPQGVRVAIVAPEDTLLELWSEAHSSATILAAKEELHKYSDLAHIHVQARRVRREAGLWNMSVYICALSSSLEHKRQALELGGKLAAIHLTISGSNESLKLKCSTTHAISCDPDQDFTPEQVNTIAQHIGVDASYLEKLKGSRKTRSGAEVQILYLPRGVNVQEIHDKVKVLSGPGLRVAGSARPPPRAPRILVSIDGYIKSSLNQQAVDKITQLAAERAPGYTSITANQHASGDGRVQVFYPIDKHAEAEALLEAFRSTYIELDGFRLNATWIPPRTRGTRQPQRNTAPAQAPKPASAPAPETRHDRRRANDSAETAQLREAAARLQNAYDESQAELARYRRAHGDISEFTGVLPMDVLDDTSNNCMSPEAPTSSAAVSSQQTPPAQPAGDVAPAAQPTGAPAPAPAATINLDDARSSSRPRGRERSEHDGSEESNKKTKKVPEYASISVPECNEALRLTGVTKDQAKQHFRNLVTPWNDELVHLVNEDGERNGYCFITFEVGEARLMQLRKVLPRDRRFLFEYTQNGETKQSDVVMSETHLVRLASGRWLFRGVDPSMGRWLICLSGCAKFVKRALLSSLL